MTLLDATGLIALLSDELGAQDVEALLRGGDVRMTAVNFAEVVDQAVRTQGKPLADVDRALAPLIDREIVTVTEVSEVVGRRAGEIRARRYDRRRSPLSLADCILLGAAGVAGDAIATSDQTLVDAAIAERLTVRPLRNSRGVRPAVHEPVDR